MNEPAVLVTGASTGIGRATALRLDTLGFRVFAGVRREQDGDDLRKAASRRLQPIHLDVTEKATIDAAAQTIAVAVADSRLAGIVNNAGVAVAGPVEFLPLDDFRKQLEINLIGQVAVTQAFLPLLREGKGRVVFVSSVAGRFSQPFMSPYCASKAGLESVADALRLELKPWKIDVSIVEPGSIATPIWNKGSAMADDMLARVSPKIREYYGTAIHLLHAVSKREAQAGISPEKVAAVIEHALTADRPKIRYVVGRDAKMMLLAKRLLTDRARDALILRVGKLPRTPDQAGERQPSPAKPPATPENVF